MSLYFIVYTGRDFNPQINGTTECQFQNMHLVIQKTLIFRAVLYLKSNILYNPVECFSAYTQFCVLKPLSKNTQTNLFILCSATDFNN